MYGRLKLEARHPPNRPHHLSPGQTNTLLRKLLEDKDALTPIATLPLLSASGDPLLRGAGGGFGLGPAAATAAAVAALKPPNKGACVRVNVS
jgi:hypothetical protein